MKKKQAIAFLLSTTMAVGGAVQAFAAASDINGHWAEATIAKWQSVGKIGGYEDGTFKPDKTITRAEFVRLLNTATATSFTSSANISFSDVKESDWFFADVAKAVGSKITSGFEDGTFRPSETVTRAQAAVFICNAKGLAPNESAANTFADAAQIPAWAKGAVGAVVTAGYMSGYPDGSFGAGKGMTRAEAVSTLDRFSGTTTTPAPDNQGVSTPDVQDKEDTTIAEAPAQEGNMVWRSGGGGGSSRGSSSSNGGSSSSDKDDNDIVTKDTTISNQRDADKLKGKTVFGDVTINLNSDLDLENVKFKGDVKVNSGTVAAAYIGDDTAVAAASSFKWTITLVGTTSFDGNVTVTSESTSAPLVEIVTRTRKSINSFIARAAARIVGFDTVKVQASAPVKVADGKVENITAEKDAEITLEKDATITKVEVAGDAKVTVEDGASVTNVAVSGSAKAEIEVKGTANVGEVAISGSATATVDVAESAKVDKITSTSSGKTEVTGDGTISKIEATNPDTVDTTGATKAPDVEQIGGSEEKPGDGEEETTEIAKATITALTVDAPTKAGDAVTTSKIENVDITTSGKWKVKEEQAQAGGTEENKKVTVEATVTLKPSTGCAFAADVADLTLGDFKTGVTVADITKTPTTGTPTEITLKLSHTVDDSTAVDPDPDVKPTTMTIAAEGSANTIVQGGTLQFEATFTGTGYESDGQEKVTWAVDDAATTAGVTIANGLLTVPEEVTKDTEIIVTATSNDFTDADGKPLSGTATVTVEEAMNDKALQAELDKVTDAVKANTFTVTLSMADTKATAAKKIADAAKAAVKDFSASCKLTFAIEGDFTPATTLDKVSGKFTVKQNGATTGVSNEEAVDVKVSVTEEVVESVSITLTAPAVGETPAKTATSADGTKYDVVTPEGAKAVTWKVEGATAGEFTEVGADAKFEAGKKYQAVVKLQAKDGYKFVENTTTPVDEKGTLSDFNAENKTVMLTITYAALSGGSEVTGASISRITATPKDAQEALSEKDGVVKMVAPAEQTTISLGAELANVTEAGKITWTVADVNTSGVGAYFDTAGTATKQTDVTVTGEAGKETATAAPATLTVPKVTLDESTESKSIKVTATYGATAQTAAEGEEGSEPQVGSKELTITFTKDGSEGTPIAATDIGAMSVTAAEGTAPTRLTIAKIDSKDVPVNSVITWATKGDTPTPTTELTAGQTYTATVTLAPIGGTNTFAENFSLAGKKVTVNNAEQGTDITVTGESLGLNTEKTKYTFTFDVTVVADPDANKPSVGTFTGKEGTGTESDTVAVTVNGTATNTSTVTLKVVPTNPTVGDKIKFTVAKANANASGDLKNTTEFVGGTNKTLEVAIAEDNKTNVPATLTISGDEELSLTVTAEYLKVTDGIASSLNPKSEESITVNVTNPIIKTVDLSESSILALTVDEELTAPNVTIPSGVLYKETIDGTAKWVTIADNGTATPVDNVGDTDNPAIVLPSTKYGISVTLEANTDANNGGVVDAKFDDTANYWAIDKVTPPKDMEVKKATLAADGKLTVVFAFTAATDPSEASVASDAKLTMAEGNKNVNDNQEIPVTLKGCKVKTGGLTNQDASSWISSDSLTGNWTNVTATGNAGEQTITFTFGTLSSDLSNELSGNNNKIKIAIPKDMLEGSSLTDGSTLDVEVPVALASAADPVE